MKKYYPDSALSSDEKLKKVAAYVGLALPKSGDQAEQPSSSVDQIISSN